MDLHAHNLVDTFLHLHLAKYDYKYIQMYPTTNKKYDCTLGKSQTYSNPNKLPAGLMTILNMCKNKYVAIYLLDDTSNYYNVSINNTIVDLQDHTEQLKKNNITKIGIFNSNGENISQKNMEHL